MGISVSVQRKYANFLPLFEPERLDQYYTPLKSCYFILWDVGRKRGWMVDGLTMALYMLLVQLDQNPRAKHFDTSQLKNLNAPNLADAEQVLRDDDNLDLLVWTTKDPNDNPDNTEDGGTKRKSKPTRIAHLVEDIFKSLWKVTTNRYSMEDIAEGAAAPFKDRFHKSRWDSRMMGYDYSQLANIKTAGVPQTFSFSGRPHWLRLAKALEASFVYGKFEQEVLQPRLGSTCGHFTGLPPYHNLLAVGMNTLSSLINGYELDVSPDDDYACRLEYEVGWSSPVKPFGPPCDPNHGLDKLGDRCFPIQEVMKITTKESILVRGKGADTKYKTLVTRREFRDMESAHKNGVVVFGNRPSPKELKIEFKAMADDLRKLQEAQASTTAAVDPAVSLSSTSRTLASDANQGIAPRRSLTSTQAATTGRASGSGHAHSVHSQEGRNNRVAVSTSTSSHATSSPSTTALRPQAQKPASSSGSSVRSHTSSALATTTATRPHTPSSGSPSAALGPQIQREGSTASAKSTNSAQNRVAASGLLHSIPQAQPSASSLCRTTTGTSSRTTTSVSSRKM